MHNKYNGNGKEFKYFSSYLDDTPTNNMDNKHLSDSDVKDNLNEINDTIKSLYKQIDYLNIVKKEHEKILVSRCDHKWVMDYSDGMENKSDYLCEKCNVYKKFLKYHKGD
jgi:hypothetical protein